jgi:membrane protein required for beta-lactamase induction
MKLITVLIALGVEARLGNFERFRNLSWFVHYCDWLEARLAHTGFWNGPGGLLLTLFIPLALLGVVVYLAGVINILLGFLLSFLALVYSFGPPLGSLVDSYVDALGSGDDAACREFLEKILYGDPEEGAADRDRVIGSIMLRSHEYLFAVIFWFLLLGAVGAVMYCLVVNLAQRYEKADGGYAGAVRDLHNILMWPSSRMLALGFALGGSLVSALESWRTVSGHTLDVSREVVTVSGFGALHYAPADGEKTDQQDNEDFVNRLRETTALINRTLIVWLIVLGLMTIAGWLS